MIPPAILRKYARLAKEHGDARTLAFVAGQTSSGRDALLLADRAVALDPQFTWIYSQVSRRLWGSDPQTQATRERLIRRLEAWDPDNSFPYLMEAHEVLARRGFTYPMLFYLDRLANEPAWRQAMEKAFVAPRYDSYAARWFELNRAWLGEHGLARPAVFLSVLGTRPLPNLGGGGVRSYADLLIKELGKKAEAAGHVDEALSYYWAVAHMGERLHLQGATLPGESLQMEAYGRLLPLLRSTGRVQEAATIEYALAQLSREGDIYRGKDPFAQTSSYAWAATILDSFAALVIILGAFTALCVVYVIAKRWVRREKKGPIYRIVTAAESYLAILLFVACLGLYLSYYPYAQNFHHYMTASGEIHDFEPLLYSVLPTFGGLPGQAALPVGNPFRPYVWYALVGLVLAVLAAFTFRRGTASAER
jgi:hypothetical protein